MKQKKVTVLSHFSSYLVSFHQVQHQHEHSGRYSCQKQHLVDSHARATEGPRRRHRTVAIRIDTRERGS